MKVLESAKEVLWGTEGHFWASSLFFLSKSSWQEALHDVSLRLKKNNGHDSIYTMLPVIAFYVALHKKRMTLTKLIQYHLGEFVRAA